MSNEIRQDKVNIASFQFYHKLGIELLMAPSQHYSLVSGLEEVFISFKCIPLSHFCRMLLTFDQLTPQTGFGRRKYVTFLNESISFLFIGKTFPVPWNPSRCHLVNTNKYTYSVCTLTCKLWHRSRGL